MGMREWRECKLSELMQIIGGGTPKTNVAEYWGGDIPWLSVKDFNSGFRTVYHTEKSITELGLKNSSAKLLNKGDLIISARGTVGEIAQLGYPMAFNQSCYGLRANNKTINDYLYYLIKNEIDSIKSKTHGSVFDTITRKTFDILEVTIPNNIKEQQAIAHILSTLDDKIEVNNQINKKLEEMAQAMFKHWFVDFEFPNENGEPYKSSGGEMVESELGMIPKGWEVGSATDQFSVQSGGTPKTKVSEYWNGEIPFFTPKDSHVTSVFAIDTEKRITQEGLSNCNSKLYSVGTVFITARGTVGNVAMAGRQMAMNQSCYALVGNEGYSNNYVYFLAIQIVEKLKMSASGSVFNAIIVATFSNLKAVKPNKQVVAQFDEIIDELLSLILINTNENEKLIEIRNTLLPKLMSGEIRVPLNKEES